MEIGSIFSIVLLTSISNYSILAYFSIVLLHMAFLSTAVPMILCIDRKYDY